MKILLINTPRSPENMILKSASKEAKYFIHKKLIGPPLGLLTVAAAVKDYDVVFIDTKGEYDLNPNTPALKEFVKSLLLEHKPDIVGTTTIASEFDYAIEIFETVKEINPEILTVVGGLHTTLCLEDFNQKCVDIVCPGESAGIFREVVQTFEKKETFDKVGGIYIYGKNGLKLSNAPRKDWNSATNNFLMPDRNLLKRWISTYTVGGNPNPATYIFTSLGCPYECTFCSIWPQYKCKFHQRNVESVIEELKTITDYKIIRFADANTIVNKKFIDNLFDRIKEEGIKKEFIMDIRADTAVNNPKLIEKLAKGGLKVVITGFESFREDELKKYNKSSAAENNNKAIEVFHKNGINLRGNYVIPNDYDIDDFTALSEYSASHKVVYAGYTILTPMPGTVFYNQVKDQIIDFDLKKYNFFNSVMKTKLPLEKFYENVGKLWLIKKGTDVLS